ncbi:MAG: hypothetical protein F4Y67_03020 [Chloroflexi bacterium]|nr:hypothetical protein [Chloroflexota bacterium]
MTLKSLYEEPAALDEKLLVGVLGPLIRLTPNPIDESEAIRPLPAFDELNRRQKVLTVLITQRARVSLGDIDAESLGVSPVQIEEWTGIPGGSLRPLLRRMLTDRIISQPDRGRYQVPLYAIERAAQEISGDSA